MKVRAVSAVAVGAAAVLSLSGCGSDLGPDLHPGRAAVVGEHEISLGDVDSGAEAYCSALEPSLAQSGLALPMSSIRDELVSVMVDENLSRQYAEANDIDVHEDVRAQMAQLNQDLNNEQSGVAQENRGTIRDFNRLVIYTSSVRAAAGAAAAQGQQLPADQQLEQGRQEIDAWAEAHDVEISVDPRFDQSGDDSNSLSVAVGEVTKRAVAARAEVSKPQPDAEKIKAYTESLPDSQKCG